MNVDVTGHHVDVTPALRDYVTNRLRKLERHFDNVTQAHVVLTLEKLKRKAEATIRVSGGSLHADAAGEDMYAAIDAMADKLDRQIKRHKEKLTDHHRSEGGLKSQTG